MAEVKVVLSSILRRFKVALPSTRPLPIPSLELTLKSSTGFHLTVSRRWDQKEAAQKEIANFAISTL